MQLPVPLFLSQGCRLFREIPANTLPNEFTQDAKEYIELKKSQKGEFDTGNLSRGRLHTSKSLHKVLYSYHKDEQYQAISRDFMNLTQVVGVTNALEYARCSTHTTRRAAHVHPWATPR